MINENETFGRYNDRDYKKELNNNIVYPINNKEKIDVEIEYRDEEGKKLKPKEIARYQSYIFHGENAGIRKREKKILRDLKQKRVTNQLQVSLSMVTGTEYLPTLSRMRVSLTTGMNRNIVGNSIRMY